jgi:hypothetical protein
MASMVEKPARGRIERLEKLIKRALASASAALAQLAILGNRVQMVNAAGAIVAAGAAITPDVAITTVGPTGKIKISANFSGVGGGGAGGVHAFLQVKIGAGPFATVYSWVPVATGGTVDGAGTSLVVNTAAPVGTVVQVHWQTTAGDDALTLGGVVGAGVDGAQLLVEEVI